MSNEIDLSDKILNCSKSIYNENIVKSMLGVDGFCIFTYPNGDTLSITKYEKDGYVRYIVGYKFIDGRSKIPDINILTVDNINIAIKDFIDRLNSDTPWLSSIKADDSPVNEEKPKRIFWDNLIAVDKGALQMVVNVMRRAGKDEIIEAFLDSCVDIEDVLKHFKDNE